MNAVIGKMNSSVVLYICAVISGKGITITVGALNTRHFIWALSLFLL